MGKLQDIIHDGNGAVDRLRRTWDSTESAGEPAALPPGEYICHAVAGQLERSRSNSTPGYKLTFRVIEGEHVGRHIWLDLWLTEAAMGFAKRDLSKLGVTSLDQLEQPLPQGIRCACKVVKRRADDGTEYNRLKSFSVICVDEPEQDAFAPTDEAAMAQETSDEDALGEASLDEARDETLGDDTLDGGRLDLEPSDEETDDSMPDWPDPTGTRTAAKPGKLSNTSENVQATRFRAPQLRKARKGGTS